MSLGVISSQKISKKFFQAETPSPTAHMYTLEAGEVFIMNNMV